MQTNMRMFRAQRNFYISGFTLFLYFVIRRLIILIIKEAELQVHLEASLKQAKSASNAARSLLEQQDDSKSNDEVYFRLRFCFKRFFCEPISSY